MFSRASHGGRVQDKSQKLRSGADKESSPPLQGRSTLAQSSPATHGKQESPACQKGQQRRIQKGLDHMTLATRDRLKLVAALQLPERGIVKSCGRRCDQAASLRGWLISSRSCCTPSTNLTPALTKGSR